MSAKCIVVDCSCFALWGSTHPYLWKPAGEVVHDNSCNERLAKASGQTDQCVLQQCSLDDVHLVCPLIHCSGVHPVLGIAPAAVWLSVSMKQYNYQASGHREERTFTGFSPA